MNNRITACRYEKSTGKFGNRIFECSNKNEHVVKEPYEVYGFITVNKEIKLQILHLTYIKWDLIE